MGVGLAIGAESLRACGVSGWWRGLRLGWCGSTPLPAKLIRPSPHEENIACVAGFGRHLGTVLRGLWLRRRLRVGLPDSAVRVRIVFADELPRDPAACRRYLLWRLAELLDCRPEESRLAYLALPNPLRGHRLAVICAVTGEEVARQYERALAEGGVRYSGMAPSSLLLFNLFQHQLTAPPGSPTFFLAATEEALTTIMTVQGCPIFWRTHPPMAAHDGGLAPGNGNGRQGHLLQDIHEAMIYGETKLGLDPPTRLLVTGPLAEQRGLPAWLTAQLGLPVEPLDAGRLVRRVPRSLRDSGLTRWGVALGAAARP